MKAVRVFEGATKSEAMHGAIFECGVGSLIVGCEMITRGGLFGFGAKKVWQVKVVADD